LGCGASAIGAGDAREIIVGVVAGLRVGAVERVGDGQLIERAVGVPGEAGGPDAFPRCVFSRGLRS
ncbi:MAG TPA: hypothetical protein VNH65_17465, partial [Candidatus Acidoferrum sp.]|nr:hypothetical protein [Candidatus Acidoferrum sp.]